ncbi:MAG: universal stress protein [Actinomycetota bacterium]|nr:universal stress protein [Actinomycetota bacterium]
MDGSRLRRVLVGFDGSIQAQAALELAVDLAHGSGAQVTVLFILPDTQHLESEESRLQASQRVRSELETHLAPLRRYAAAVGVPLTEVALHGGDPAASIASYAAAHGFDVVVIGSHGRERALHGGLGRVVERLLREPRVPVLVVPGRNLS